MQDIILFYKPEGYYGCFSNWYPIEFVYMGIKFTSSEQFLMYHKAKMFDDFEIANAILNSNNLDTIKKLGRTIKNYDDQRWNNARFQIMRRGLRAKFSQNFEILHTLIQTKNCIIAEASPRDKIWGIGLDINNQNAVHPEKWNGENLLGKTLMKVRSDLHFMLNRSTNCTINTINTIDFPHHFIWNIKIKKLLNIPELKETLECYLYSLPQIFQTEEQINIILEKSLSEIENQIYSPWHGIEPVDGFLELKQDINEMLLYGMLDKYIISNKDIYFFSKYWISMFNNKNKTIVFEKEFKNDMEKLFFTMDTGKSFANKYPDLPFSVTSVDMLNVLKTENDLDLLTCTLYSMYRKITHWDQDDLFSVENKNWFLVVLNRICKLTK